MTELQSAVLEAIANVQQLQDTLIEMARELQ